MASAVALSMVPVAYQYTAKSAFVIAGQRRIPGFFNRGPCSYAANIGVFDNGKYDVLPWLFHC